MIQKSNTGAYWTAIENKAAAKAKSLQLQVRLQQIGGFINGQKVYADSV